MSVIESIPYKDVSSDGCVYSVTGIVSVFLQTKHFNCFSISRKSSIKLVEHVVSFTLTSKDCRSPGSV